VPKRLGSRSRTAAPRNVYRCADGGWLALSASTQPMTERLLRAIGRPELIDEPRFADNAARLANLDELDALLAEHFAGRTRAENLAAMAGHGVTVAPVCDIADLVDHDYVTSRGVIVEGPDGVPMHAVVPRLSVTPGEISRPAPRLGEHNGEILGDRP
jgi:formyl-CoA transferase